MIGKVKTFAWMFNSIKQANQTKKYTSVVFDNTQYLKDKKIVLILVVKDEAHRIPYFLEYYRKLGVEHFIVIDNNSSDDLHQKIRSEIDVSCFLVTQNYNESKYGVNWINYFGRQYCVNKWVLSVDADEFLVYPHDNARNLHVLCDYMSDIGQTRLFTPLIDMYSDLPVRDTHYIEGDDPLKHCAYFDGDGYFSEQGYYGDYYMRGGVRMRKFSASKPNKAPALNKYALMYWTKFRIYYIGAHVVLPKRLNKLKYSESSSSFLKTSELTGALLHFKFFSDLYEKAEFAVENGNHYDDSSEYKKYLKELEGFQNSYKYSGSIKYEDVDTLSINGLVNSGVWL